MNDCSKVINVFFKNNFMYLFLSMLVFVVARGLLSSGGVQVSHWGGFSCGAQVPGVGFSSCPSRALESRLSSHTGLVALQLWVFPD